MRVDGKSDFDETRRITLVAHGTLENHATFSNRRLWEASSQCIFGILQQLQQEVPRVRVLLLGQIAEFVDLLAVVLLTLPPNRGVIGRPARLAP